MKLILKQYFKAYHCLALKPFSSNTVKFIQFISKSSKSVMFLTVFKSPKSHLSFKAISKMSIYKTKPSYTLPVYGGM